ncbi:MAG: hypothetical protein PUF11_01205 [Parafannyhessea umbonata]|uniref:hypothetical protein n=1 Tax=Parafannyhessea umbonata TaxID=604330 RepID=UPI0026F1FB8C|nr:hypothetical protein [Parafannyhessea umbonata]MDD6565394.1 hypothetical protein [Parafannyhessea umbonata]
MSKQCVTLRSPRHTALSCVVATTTAAVALSAPAIALADEPASSAPTEEPSATTTAAATPSVTAPYTTTQTVVNNEQTFPTKDEAQSYLDDAKSTWAEKDKKDTTSTYEVKTTGPEKVNSTTTSTTTTEKEGNEEFGTKDEADKWIEENTSGYQNAGGTTYDVQSGVDKVESGTTEVKNDNVASDKKDGFTSKQKAEDWVASQTEKYKATADTAYTVDSTVAPKEDFSTKGEKGDATTEKYGPFDSEEEAAAERAAKAANDPGDTLREVAFGDVTSKKVGTKTETVPVQGDDFYSTTARNQALKDATSEAEREGYNIENVKTTCSGQVVWGDKYDYASTEYSIGANGFAIIKQSTWYAIWTPDAVDQKVVAAIRDVAAHDNNDNSLKGDPIAFFHGFGTRFSTSDNNSGEYWVTKNGDGSYTVHVSSSDTISHLDWGTLPTYSYSFDETRETPILKWYFTETIQSYMPVVEWSAEYTVSSVTKVPTYKYKAWYKVTKTEKVTKDVWKAGYEVVKTTTFAPPVTPPTTPPTTPPVTPPTTPPVTPPATPKTPEAPKAAVQKAAVQKQVTVAKAAVPRTSDSTNLAGAGILAGLAVAFGAAGIVLRRRARKLD